MKYDEVLDLGTLDRCLEVGTTVLAPANARILEDF